MTPPAPSLHDLEQRLRRARLPLPADEAHRAALRRALLQSSYFPEPASLAAWRRRLLDPWRRPAQWATAIGSMGMGAALAAALLATPARPAAAPSAAPTAVAVEAESTPTLAQTLQRWHEQGDIRYARQEPNGERVYTLHLEDGNQIELHDHTPFSISVASFRR